MATYLVTVDAVTRYSTADNAVDAITQAIQQLKEQKIVFNTNTIDCVTAERIWDTYEYVTQ